MGRLALFLLTALVGFPCQHGPVCDSYTVSFDRVDHFPPVLEYRVYWGSNAIGPVDEDGFPFHAQETIDVCPVSQCFDVPTPWVTTEGRDIVVEPGSCVCDIETRRPSPGNVVFFSVVAVNVVGEGPH